MFAIIIGNVVDGIELVGPFTTQKAARHWINNDVHIDDHEWIIARLQNSGDTLDYVSGPVPEPEI